MPSILSKQLASKLLGSEWSFGYNCYEVGHCWTPSCTDAALEISLAAGVRVLPLYALLYGFSQVAIQKRLDPETTWQTVKSIVRSTSFIFFHFYNGAIFGCALRNISGRFYYRVLVCIPALLSSYLSLLVEKPARRQALAFYMLNLAAEILYRMATTSGYFRPIKHGETLLFALSLAAWYHLLKTHGFGHDPVSAVVKLLIGPYEAKSRAKKTIVNEQQQHQLTSNSSSTSIHSEINKLQDEQHEEQQQEEEALSTQQSSLIASNKSLEQQLGSNSFSLANSVSDAINFVGKSWLGNRHSSCPHGHDHATCFHYVIQPIPSRFLIGCSIQALLRLSSRPHELIRNPLETIAQSLLSRGSIKFGLFLVTLVSSGRLTSCLLRRYSNSNEPHWHGTVSGLVAGLSMLWSPKPSMYVMMKAIEQYYLLAARQGKIQYFNFSILTIYSLSAATLLYTFALEPSLMRPSYMKFLDKISDHRLHQLNRMVLDVFGTGSSIGYEDYFPDLDPDFMSNQFKELIFNWMIQPYE